MDVLFDERFDEKYHARPLCADAKRVRARHSINVRGFDGRNGMVMVCIRGPDLCPTSANSCFVYHRMQIFERWRRGSGYESTNLIQIIHDCSMYVPHWAQVKDTQLRTCQIG